MSKLDEIRETAGARGKSLLVTVADILESLTKQNLAFANDVSRFAVAQVRLPTQADDFSDYRERTKDAYVKFGKTLKGRGGDLIDVIREVPEQIKNALTDQPVKAPVSKAAKVSKPKAAKKAPVKKVAAKSTASKAAA